MVIPTSSAPVVIVGPFPVGYSAQTSTLVRRSSENAHPSFASVQTSPRPVARSVRVLWPAVDVARLSEGSKPRNKRRHALRCAVPIDEKSAEGTGPPLDS